MIVPRAASHPQPALDLERARVFAEQLAKVDGSGRSAEDIARDLQISVSLEEAVERGWFTEADKRVFEGHARLEDLQTMGFEPDEIEEMLGEQEERRAAE